MKSVNLKLDSIDKVKTFVNVVSVYSGDFDLASERYVVDAKSIMGIFSLDLSKTLRLDIADDANYEQVCEKLKAFIVE